ncbi:MAG: toluene tolerance protein [Betaproteobacteria bacterium]|nr:toluene tolerance protein [Betaproteobacteria bacterium]
MQTLSHDAYLALRANATVVERDLHGEKVLQLEDGNYLKLFRRKRLISSTAWYPYAQRFADNALTLEKRAIPCPSVIATYRIPGIKRDAVLYAPLAGRSLRQIIQSGEGASELRTALGKFIARLHSAGIYFRSLHLGNIVLSPSGNLGLIDIADLRARSGALSSYLRRRNMQQLYRDPQDRAWLCADGSTAVEDAYRAAGGPVK